MGVEELALPASVQATLGQLVNAAKDGLLALSVGVGLGVLHELMEVEVVRHEARLDRAGCETSLPGCRSGRVKLGAVRAWSCGGGREQPRQSRAVGAPSDLAGPASKAERCNESESVVELPQDSTRLEPDGSGPAKRCVDSQALVGIRLLAAMTSRCRWSATSVCVIVAAGPQGESRALIPPTEQQ